MSTDEEQLGAWFAFTRRLWFFLQDIEDLLPAVDGFRILAILYEPLVDRLG